jgi:hypothetical protein
MTTEYSETVAQNNPQAVAGRTLLTPMLLAPKLQRVVFDTVGGNIAFGGDRHDS